MRQNAANWLELADKIYHYRNDLMSSADRSELHQKTEALRAQLKARDDASKLKLGIEALEPVLRKTGGVYYPKSTVQEYVEFFLVAAIVVIGIRTYFVQPFKIPTNSMWPTYHGMTHVIYKTPAEEPSTMDKTLAFVTEAAEYHQLVAPEDGEVEILVTSRGMAAGNAVRGFNLGRKRLFSSKEYFFRVGSQQLSVLVPSEFGFESVVSEAFFDDPAKRLSIHASAMFRAQKAQPSHMVVKTPTTAGIEDERTYWIPTGIKATAGQSFLSFTILTGDQLFVDRVSYNFVRPSVGSGFVFRTGNIARIGTDQYYIKRLVGVPGDTLEIKQPELFRNGEPITGADAFEKNARKEGKYRGYFNAEMLDRGNTVTVPSDGYFAMGDNSGYSYDSRYWGFVPKKDVIGRPLFIYYPFTKRWGPAK